MKSLEAKIRCLNCSNEESKIHKKDSYHLAAIFYEIVTGSRFLPHSKPVFPHWVGQMFSGLLLKKLHINVMSHE